MLGDGGLRGSTQSPGRRSTVARGAEDPQKKEIDAIRGEVQKLVEIQKIVENDENLGIPEA